MLGWIGLYDGHYTISVKSLDFEYWQGICIFH